MRGEHQGLHSLCIGFCQITLTKVSATLREPTVFTIKTQKLSLNVFSTAAVSPLNTVNPFHFLPHYSPMKHSMPSSLRSCSQQLRHHAPISCAVHSNSQESAAVQNMHPEGDYREKDGVEERRTTGEKNIRGRMRS